MSDRPLDLAICQKSTELDFTSDPADELIAAASIVHRVPLVTRDKKIRASKLVPWLFPEGIDVWLPPWTHFELLRRKHAFARIETSSH
jgi:hypothetical protein